MQLNNELRMDVQRFLSFAAEGRLICFINITDQRDPFNEY